MSVVFVVCVVFGIFSVSGLSEFQTIFETKNIFTVSVKSCLDIP